MRNLGLRKPVDNVAPSYAGPVQRFGIIDVEIQSDGVNERRIDGAHYKTPKGVSRPVTGTFIRPRNNPKIGPPQRFRFPNARPYAIVLSGPKVKKLSHQTVDRHALARSYGDQSGRVYVSTVANDISQAVHRKTPKRGG